MAISPKQKDFFGHVRKRWSLFSDRILTQESSEITVRLEHFEKVEVTNKTGEIKKRLKQVTSDASLFFLTYFISDFLPKFIHHPNELKHFRSVSATFHEYFKAINTDLDYSENLTLPMKQHPQSMYWALDTVTVHSGIVKSINGK